ncbi:hypothetical protein [Paludisphaera mucosa]|uniref:DUF3108 domain-containing protein n=1 Tax=Paludisphaera mucosa TaxID=3030827 RepID=A0ABT6FFN7_9BACT|nr:hypothetical protein [Paludisphaera mucosa]MDG3006208.1 hypothetical protein [Paludisphaera mucosa]
MLWTRLRYFSALAALATAGMMVLASGAAQDPEAAKAAVQGAASGAPASETPEQFLAGVFKTYAGAKSYEDEGESTAVFISAAGGRRTVKKPFSTRFVRPKLFYYEFTARNGEGEEEKSRYVVWTDAAPERSKIWWTLRPEIQDESLHLALGSGAGISGGSATIIPALLMPETIMANRLRVLKGLKFAGEEVVDESACRKFEGKNLQGEVETIWVDKTTLMVRRIVSTMKIPGHTVETTTTYRPRMDVEIPRERFDFTPPGS